MGSKSQIDYLTTDFDSSLESLKDFAKVNFSNRFWSDFNVDSFGTVILELVSYVNDVQSYYLDKRANEAYAASAQQDQSKLDISGQMGYFGEPASVSSGKAVFSLIGAASIPTQFRVSKTGLESVTYYTTQSGSVTQVEYDTGTTSIELDIQQGDPKVDPFVANGIQNERFALTNFPIIVKSLDVIIGGDSYERVDTFINSKPEDKHYKLLFDSNNIPILEFGDGLFGKKLSLGQVVTVNYDIGGGTEGNADIGEVTTLLDTATNVISVTNNTEISGATDEKTADEIVDLAPTSVKSLALVTIQDFQDQILLNINGVAKVSAESTPTTDDVFDIDVYAVPSGSEITKITDNNILLSEVRDFLELRKLLNSSINIRDAFTVPINIEVEIFVSNNFFVSTVQSNLEAALKELFSFDTITFGQQFLLNDIYTVVESITGIDRYEIKILQVDPQPRYRRTNFSETGVQDVETNLSISANGTNVISVVSSADFGIGDIVQLTTDDRHHIIRTITNIASNIITLDGIVPTYFTILNDAKVLKQDRPYFSFVQTYANSEESKWVIENDTATTYNVHKDLFGTVSGLTKGSLTDNKANFEVQSGNSTSVATGQLTDESKCLVPDSFAGHLLVDAAGAVFAIDSHTDNEFTLNTPSLDISASTTPATGAYSVVKSLEGKTLILGILEVPVLYNTKNSIVTSSTLLDQAGIIGSDYKVRISQVNTGTYGTKYFSDDNEVSFTIYEGNSPSQGNPDPDSYEFTITNKADDIVVLANNELPIEGNIIVDPRGGLS